MMKPPLQTFAVSTELTAMMPYFLGCLILFYAPDIKMFLKSKLMVISI